MAIDQTVLELVPQRSIGPFILGASREQIRSAAKAAGFDLSSSRGSLDWFERNSIQVEFDDEGLAWFIGVSPMSSNMAVVFDGLSVFDTPAVDVFAFIQERDGSPNQSFSPNGHTFPQLVVTLYEADQQYDCIRRERGGPLRSVWGQVGTGNPDYLAAVSNL